MSPGGEREACGAGPPAAGVSEAGDPSSGPRSQQREPAKIGEPPGELNPQQHRGLRSCVTQHFRGRKLVACVRW